jgi:dihydrofolate reductase/thymidylate synthase
MFDVIVACTNECGIGLKGQIAWSCPEELKLFRRKTMGAVLIMGRKTVENLPKLSNRTIICVSRKTDLDTSKYKNPCTVFKSVESALTYAKEMYPDKKIFISGGGGIYNYTFAYLRDHIDSLHISFMKENYTCDTFIYINQNDWELIDTNTHESFTHHVLKYNYGCNNSENKLETMMNLSYDPNGEAQYLKLIKEALTWEKRDTRNGVTRSSFNNHLSFDLSKGFPLLTTKKMFTRGIIEELLFFIRGETDTTPLKEKKVRIWEGNTDRAFLDKIGMPNRKEGIMGPMYGYQWRYFNAEYDEKTGNPVSTRPLTCLCVAGQRDVTKGVDQLKHVVDTIRNDPQSRRILMTDFNPAQASQGVLYPCHSIILQFYVNQGKLDMFCYIRSSDMFLGLPFNIASSSILLILIATITNLEPGNLHITLGDSHIYEDHIDQVKEQISRHPYKFPTLRIKKEIHEIDDIERLIPKDFEVVNYHHYPSIKAKMVA